MSAGDHMSALDSLVLVCVAIDLVMGGGVVVHMAAAKWFLQLYLIHSQCATLPILIFPLAGQIFKLDMWHSMTSYTIWSWLAFDSVIRLREPHVPT